MLIFNFEKTILADIKAKIDETLPAISGRVKYFDYEPADNEITALPEEEVFSNEIFGQPIRGYKGAVCVFVRNTKKVNGCQAGTWETNNEFNICCYGFDHASIEEGETELDDVIHTSSENANINSKALVTAAFLATTDRTTIFNSFNTVDENGDRIIIGTKTPEEIKLYTQEDLRKSEVGECLRVFKLTIHIEERTDPETLGELLNHLNKQLESKYK